MRIQLDTVTNIASLVVCGLIVGVVAAPAVVRQIQRPRPYQVGQRVTELDRSQFKEVERTLLVIVQSNCGYCRESLPFYRQLLEADRQSGDDKKFKVVLVFLDDTEQAVDFVKANKLRARQAMSLSPKNRSLRVTSTPTLLIVVGEGIVRKTWIGKLDADGEATVMKQLMGQASVSTGNN